MTTRVAIFGQGYVGLPLAMEAVKAGMFVTGIETDLKKIQQIREGISPVIDITNHELSAILGSSRYWITEKSDFDALTNVICICVPTPLNLERKPDMSFLKTAAENVGLGLKAGMLVIIESTIQPGATREFVLPILKKVSGLNQDEFLLAFSPERIDPSNKKWGLRNTTKLVSGLSAEAALKAKEFYSQFVDDIKICSSVEVAETAKLLENAFRFINISFVNEMAFFCNKLGIEISEVIGAAATKPFGFMEFYPSIGIGGHCIPVDPMYLSSKASDINSPVSMIDLAEQINKSVPHYIVKRAKVILKDLEDKKILIIGVAYKPNVSDTRETPVLDLINILSSYGAKVYWHDELVKEWNGQKSNPLSKGYDLAIIASHHDYVNLALIGDTPVINTQNSIE